MINTISFYFAVFIIKVVVCKQYYNYTLFRGIPTDDDQLLFFKNLDTIYEVNYWQQPGSLYRPVDFIIAPDYKEKLIKEATKRGIHLDTILKDVQEAFDSQTVKAYIRRKMDTFGWHSFYRYVDIYEWLRDLQAGNPDEMQLLKIGTTYEGRDLVAVRIALKGADLTKRVIVEGGIHAREWISPAFVTYMLYSILKAKNCEDADLKKAAMSYEWFFIPVTNPDGYEYTHSQDRMWRKNRQPYGNYFGVDLNRNFGLGFGTVGISHNQNAEIYCGPKAFSEKETFAIAKFVESKSKNLMYYFGFHAFGQYMIMPYGHSSKHWDNYNEVYDMCVNAQKVIKKRYGTSYKIGTAYDTVGYVVSGGSGCWVKKAFSVPVVIFFELRDQGKYGFALAPELILPTCEETLDGLVSLLNAKLSGSKLNKSLPHDSYGDGADVLKAEMVYLVVLLNVLFANIVVY